MELYCEKLNRYVDIIDNPLMIEGDSQMQSLEHYPSANSFDINIVNDSANIEIVKNNYYCTLSNNGSPLMRGRLIVQGSTPTTIKCVYQSLPYCDLFKNFHFKDTLKDYFFPTKQNDGFTLLKLEDYFENKQNSMFQFLYTRNGLNVLKTVPMLESNYWNYTPTCFANWLESEGKGRQIGTPSTYYMHQTVDQGGLSVWKREEVAFLNNCHIIRTDDFLRGIGLDVAESQGEIRPYMLAHKSMHIKCIVKVRLEPPYTPNSWQSRYSWNQSLSRIYIQVGREEWDYQAPYFDATDGFLYSIHQNYTPLAPFKCKVDRYDLIYDNDQFPFADNEGQENSICTEDDPNVHGRRLLKWRLDEAVEFDRGENFATYLPTIEGTPLGKAKFVDVHLVVDDVVTYEDYAVNIRTMRDAYAPFDSMEFLEQSTNQFLNELSLNSEYGKFLRNPLFVNKDNGSVIHNQQVVQDVFSLDEDHLVSIDKELDVEAPKKLIVKTENGVYSNFSYKFLSGSGETKEIVQKNTSSMLSFPLSSFKSTPFYYQIVGVNRDAVNKGWASKNLYFCFLKGDSKIFLMTPTREDCEWYSDSTKMSYVDTFQDHSEKYKVNCIGYKLNEYVEFEGQKFAVAHFRTRDMVHFELELYKLKD